MADANFNEIINVLKALKKKYPRQGIGRHLSIALDGGDLWGVSDKQMLMALEKYEAELLYDIPHVCDDVDRIVHDAMHLDDILEDNDPYLEE